jgi:hypothetical protein
MSFSDHQNSVKSPSKVQEMAIWHFRESRFKNFPDEHALDPLENSCIYGAQLVPLALLRGAFENFEPGAP